MSDTANTEAPTPSEVNTQATEAAVEQPAAEQTAPAPAPAADPTPAPAPEPAPVQEEQPVEDEAPNAKTLPWEPTPAMIEQGKEFIARCLSDGLTPHPRGVYQTMFAAYQGE